MIKTQNLRKLHTIITIEHMNSHCSHLINFHHGGGTFRTPRGRPGRLLTAGAGSRTTLTKCKMLFITAAMSEI